LIGDFNVLDCAVGLFVHVSGASRPLSFVFEIYEIESGRRVAGTTGASAVSRSPHHRSTPQSPCRSVTDAGPSSSRTDAHGRPVKKVIHEVIV